MIHPFRDGNTRTTMAFASIFAKEHDFPMDLGIILDNLTRKYDENGRTKRFSIRDKFVLASLDEKFAPEPEHLQALLKQSMVSGIKKKIDVLYDLPFCGYRSGDSADVPSYRCGNRRGRWPACCRCFGIGEWHYSWYYHGY